MSVAPATNARAGSRVVSGSSVNDQTGAELLPATDTLWRDVYHVIAPLPAADSTQLWRANRTDTAEEIVLRVAPGTQDDARSTALKRLTAVDLVHLQRVREVHFVGANRIEACAALRGVPLDVWRAGRPSVDTATVECVVRQIAEALGVLHATGLVHLGLRPGVVFVREEKDGLHCTLGGLESVTFFDGVQPIVAAADPRYAPPEAAALERHEPGAALTGWDWWSLGRVAQELILGHHVVNDVPGADAAQPIATRAEALLLELSAKGMRAGAVETMPGLEPRLALLLRGLLASAPEVRWTGDPVDRWLKQLPVKEHYTTPRVEKKFRWRGRLYIVAEAAKELQTAERWPEAAEHIFEPGRAGTLANFIAKSPEQKTIAPQLAELLKLAESEPLLSSSPEVAREILVTVALLLLSGGNLVWRGRRLDGESLAVMLAEQAENAERLALVRAFTHRAITGQIERHDFGASRSLAQVARCAADAEAIIRRNGWLTGVHEAVGTKIFRLALEPDATLLATRERLRRDFACSTQPAVEKIFKVAKPAHVELVVLAWVEPTAASSGFVTHVEWEAKQLQQLQERSGSIMTALSWARLGRALAAGPALFGPWIGVLAGWSVAAILMAALWPGPKLLVVALAPVVLVGVARIVFSFVPKAALQQFAPEARPWKWSDGAARCTAEMAAAGKGLDAAGLERALDEINSEIAKLKLLNPAPAPVDAPPKFASTRSAALASWALIAVIVAGCAWRFKTSEPSLQKVQFAWFPAMAEAAAKVAAAAGTPDRVAAAENFTAKAAAAEADPAANAIKVSWPYRSTDDFETLTAEETLEPTKAQMAYAMSRGKAIAAPYKKETINSFVLFQVPAGEKIGVMMFDGAHDSLVAPKVFILAYRPPARAWVELTGKKAVVVPE